MFCHKCKTTFEHVPKSGMLGSFTGSIFPVYEKKSCTIPSFPAKTKNLKPHLHVCGFFGLYCFREDLPLKGMILSSTYKFLP